MATIQDARATVATRIDAILTGLRADLADLRYSSEPDRLVISSLRVEFAKAITLLDGLRSVEVTRSRMDAQIEAILDPIAEDEPVIIAAHEPLDRAS